jgi:tetratricopeptide (TPR) repeat protein
MELDELQERAEASACFLQAWREIVTDFEKCTSAYYVAWQQASVVDKLRWDETALAYALSSNKPAVCALYPSLYLNIAKCNENLGDRQNAQKNYQLALSYATELADTGYGRMIQRGIALGLQRHSRV